MNNLWSQKCSELCSHSQIQRQIKHLYHVSSNAKACTRKHVTALDMLLKSIADTAKQPTIIAVIKFQKAFSYSYILTPRCIEPAAMDLKGCWFLYVADDRRVIVSNHSRRKFTKDFTHEQSLTIVVADVGDMRTRLKLSIAIYQAGEYFRRHQKNKNWAI